MVANTGNRLNKSVKVIIPITTYIMINKTIKNLDGFLIGKASIDVQEVIKILEVASK